MSPTPSPHLQDQDAQCHSHQYEREGGRSSPVERGLVLDVYNTGKGIVAHNRDSAEITQNIEGHQQASRRQGRSQLRQRDPPERAPGPVPQPTGGIFQSRVHPQKRSPHAEQGIRIAQQSEHQPRPWEAVDIRQPLHSKKAFQALLQHTSWPQGSYCQVSTDVAGYHQWQRSKHRPQAA